MAWLRYHKSGTSGIFAPMFGVYFGKLKGLFERGVRTYHKFEFLRYWTAELRISGQGKITDQFCYGDLSVRITPADSAYFEFFTTGKPLITGNVIVDGLPVPSVSAACIGVRIRLDNKNITTESRINQRKHSTSGQEISLVKRPFQVQLIDEPVSEIPPVIHVLDRKKYFNFMYESFAPMHSHTGVHVHSYNQGQDHPTAPILHPAPGAAGTMSNGYEGYLAGVKGPDGSHGARDVGFDIPYQTGVGSAGVVDAVLNDMVVDWPRANGRQTVVSEQYGTREYAIYIDAYSQVSVFPTSAIGAPNGTTQNVTPAIVVKTTAINLPAWVYKMTQRFRDWYTANPGDTGLTDFPENDWKIRHDGKRACAVVYKREEVIFDAGFWSGIFSSTNFLAFTNLCTGWGSRSNLNYPGHDTKRYMQATGLLEVGIQIDINGPNPEDFVVTLSTEIIRDPAVTSYCTLFAGYVLHDLPNGDALQGDLCVWDIERYYRIPNTFPKNVRYVEYPLLSPGGASNPIAHFFPPKRYDEVYVGSFSVTDFERGDAMRAFALLDNERYWGSYYNEALVWAPTPYTSPFDYDTQSGVTGDPLLFRTINNDVRPHPNASPSVIDARRTLYSLKNLTRDAAEIRTLPGSPSGVAREYYVPPYQPYAPGIGNNNTDSGDTTVIWEDYVNEVPGTGYAPVLLDSGLLVSNSVTPYSSGQIFCPMEIRGQFLRVDMSTLSFVFQFQTQTQEVRKVCTSAIFLPATTENRTDNYFTSHPAVAVYTFNVHRESFFPPSMPTSYSQPSTFYTEPAQTCPHDKLAAAALDDFRTAWMAEDGQGPWKFMGQNDNPPSGANGTWDGTDLLRYWAIFHEGSTTLRARLPVNFGAAVDTTQGELCFWYGSLATYHSPFALTMISNPRFHWYMYSDCIVNALGGSPWSTFFVHPNGTWAFYDQSLVYNRNGIPATKGSLNIDVNYDYTRKARHSPGWDATLLEHWIIDRVHFEFTIPDQSTVALDSTFRDLYNDAVADFNDRPELKPPDEVFDTIALSDLKATFSNISTSNALLVGINWQGHNYSYYEGQIPLGGGIGSLAPATNSGTIDMSLDYICSGSAPQAVDQHLTFSSCLLIE